MYQIPLDTARQDASPHGKKGNGSGTGGGITGGGSGGSGSAGGGTTGGGSGSGGGSAVSSDTGANDTAVQSQGTPVLVPGGQPGSLVHSSNGFGSSSKVPGANGTPASAGLGAVQSNASSAPVLAFLLAAVVLLLGGFVGVQAWRRRRGGTSDVPSGQPPQLPPPTA